MNSEELEQSLRTEFESYLNNAIAEMKQEVSEFQQKIDSAFESHKSQIDEAVKEFSEKFGDERELEESFRDSVSEHLKLAREDGSKITADAFTEAEKLREEEIEREKEEDSASSVEFADIRDAITEISGKDSQSEILKSLVHHATQFTPRGAFFIVKNEHLVGWRMFGTEDHPNPEVVREVFFPVASKTALSESVETLATIEGSSDANEDNLLYLNKLNFEAPENMYAIPLVARGRGVAVLYADNGTEGGNVNIEVLETLMRVAGLTVEVLASTQIAKNQASEQSSYTAVQQEDLDENQFSEETPQVEEPAVEESSDAVTQRLDDSDFSTDASSSIDFDTSEETSSEFDFQPADSVEETSSEFDFQPVVEAEESPAEEEVSFEETSEEVSYGDNSWEQPVEEPVQEFSEIESVEEDFSTSFEAVQEDNVPTVEDYQVDTNQSYESTSEFEAPQFGGFESNDETVDDLDEVSNMEAADDFSQASFDMETPVDDSFSDVSDTTEDIGQAEVVEEEVVEPVSAPPVRTRFGDRNVDLPIEVADDERRLHNDARRFARLLVSEIKLYNEQKVKEGRESSDFVRTFA